MNAAASTLPLGLAEKLAPAHGALLIIDMQNDFCAPGGYINQVMGKDVSAAANVVPALQVLLEAARTAALPVIWIGADYSFERIPDSMRVKLLARDIQTECCKPGSWGADWFGVRPRPSEPVLLKHCYSGFHGTALHGCLLERDVRTLVLAGVQTQVCVESTVRDAHSRGYFCVVPGDAVASHTPALHDAALANIRFLFGDVCAAADVVRAWSRPALAA